MKKLTSDNVKGRMRETYYRKGQHTEIIKTEITFLPK